MSDQEQSSALETLLDQQIAEFHKLDEIPIRVIAAAYVRAAVKIYIREYGYTVAAAAFASTTNLILRKAMEDS